MNFNNNFKIVSMVPGRLRVRFESFRGFYLKGSMLDGLPGIRSFHFNSQTGSLLILYDHRVLSLSTLLERLSFFQGGLAFYKILKTKLKNHRLPQAKQKRALVFQGFTLAISPLLPLPLSFFLTLRASLPYFFAGIKSFLSLRADLDLLNGLALASALFLGQYRTAGFISFLLRLGDYLDSWAKKETSGILRDYFALQEASTWIVDERGEREVPVQSLKEGMIVIVREGSRIPVDGKVLEGEAMVNQSWLTGESLPVLKRRGSVVFAGTVVEEGFLKIRAEKTGESTKIAELEQLVRIAERNKAPIQMQLERVSEKLAKFVLGGAILTGILTANPVRTLSFLLVDYSCALKLCSSIVFLSAILRAKREGLIIMGGKQLEALSEIDLFLLDKTGTLTTTKPEVVEVMSLKEDLSPEELLRIVACVEEHFPHPLARAIVDYAKAKGIHHEEEHSEVKHIIAHGIISSLGEEMVAVGSRHFIVEDLGIRENENLERLYYQSGYSLLYVAMGGELVGVILMEVPLKDEALAFVEALKRAGIKQVALVTGDSHGSAQRVAKTLGIDEYYSEVLPEDKINLVRRYQALGYKVAMLGDGLNDVPALMQADVGISFRDGADLAKEVSGIVLEGNSLQGVLFGLGLAKETLRRLNFSYKTILLVNTLLLLGSTLGIFGPGFSGVVHNLTTLVIALYNLKLKDWSYDGKESSARKT